MDQSLDKKIEFKDRIASFFINNKFKVYFFIGILIASIISLLFVNINKEKNNNLIAEKYIQAEQYLSSNENEKARNIYDQIILSKNKFYSILALNNIIEKNLVKDDNKILEYFMLVEKVANSKDQKDLITFKKALFLIKTLKEERGKSLLKNLIEQDSRFKPLAQEILSQ